MSSHDNSVAQSKTSWRVVDFVTAAVLAVACGVIFVVWNNLGYTAYKLIDAFTPGLGGLVNGMWYLGGPLGILIIRKPGAAVFVEILAAIVSMALGSQWGIATVYSGLAQGFGAELIFLLVRYKKFSTLFVLLSGAGAALLGCGYEGIAGDFAKSGSYLAIYWSCSVISGMVLAGVLAQFLVKALAKTGALDKFEASKDYRVEV